MGTATILLASVWSTKRRTSGEEEEGEADGEGDEAVVVERLQDLLADELMQRLRDEDVRHTLEQDRPREKSDNRAPRAVPDIVQDEEERREEDQDDAGQVDDGRMAEEILEQVRDRLPAEDQEETADDQIYPQHFRGDE